MPKEDRSDWVAVQPQTTAGGGSPTTIRKALSAFQFFQKEVSAAVKAELLERTGGTFVLAEHGRLVRERWQSLTEEEKEPYHGMAREDAARYARESHAADVAALQRRERLQKERDELLFLKDDQEDDDSDDDEDDKRRTRRTTRGSREKQQHQKTTKKKKKKKKTKKEHAKRKKHKLGDEEDEDDEDFKEDDEEDESEGSYEEEDSDEEDDDDDSSEEGRSKKKKRKTPTPRKKAPASTKQQEYRAKQRQEKEEKEAYIAERQQDVRKERADQAKKRLEFLLKQSNIFSHFGHVKEESAKFGIKTTAAPAAAKKETKAAPGGGGVSRRSAAVDDQDEEALEEADEHEAIYLTSQPTTLGHGTMRPYQLEGLNWMIRLQENGVNGILADEMGLGKTLQSISILVYMKEYQNITGPHLIVVPKSTLSNWMNEIGRWAPGLNAVKFHGDKATREDLIQNTLKPGQRDEDRTWNVVVTTYEVCNIEKNALSKLAFCYLIIDEAHRLKNEASAFSKTVRQFETRYRILLTGTPLQNSLHEMWALLNFLVPDVFASAEQFDEWFNLDIEDNDEKNKLISQLHKILRPFMLRRLKADVEKSLPPKHETILFTGMSAMQKKLYRDILIRDIDAIQGNSGSRTAVLNIVMQLRKCAGHPYLFPGVEDRTLPPLGEHLVQNCGKMVVLDKLLVRLKERGHRVLLFTQMTRILDIMEDYLVMRKFNYCRIDGNTSYEDREEYIDAYNAPGSDKFIFLLSTRAGGLGINLQTADVVVLYDSDWNPQADLQATDRAHRIGQKRPVQVFRLVTEHTIEERIVERAQQKLKLDAMIVQQGRLKDKDKLSRDELLAAVRFGADKIFKSKDSSITDDDIDLILDAGKRKTQELNEKLKAADKGDLLNFKLDTGGSVQTFEGVDYSSNALAQARAESEMLGIFDIGKRERKEAIYNENTLYHQQISALQGPRQSKKRKETRLPKHLRLPRMEEWQMYDREQLKKIQEEEEAVFRNLPEEQQKMATSKKEANSESATENAGSGEHGIGETFELPPLISEERQALKEKLLLEGFSDWSRLHYTYFLKASAAYGRKEFAKIAIDVGKPEDEISRFANAFWGEWGRNRISEHEYERAIKLIEKGEKKIGEIEGLERGARLLVSHFDNPWDELEFTHVNCKDKMFTAEEDRHLLCWTRKYGYGQWLAIKLALRRNPNFRFDYFLRSLPVDLLGKRCEQLMRAAEKEVEALEREARREAGLPVTGLDLPPIEIPKFRVMKKRRREAEKLEVERKKKELETNVHELESQIEDIQRRLKALNEGADVARVSPDIHPSEAELEKETSHAEDEDHTSDGKGRCGDSKDGAVGPDGTFVSFPEYNGSEPPAEWKKPFTIYCSRTRKEVKESLSPKDRKNKNIVNSLLKDRWHDLTEDEKETWRQWSEWDKKRHARELAIYESRLAGEEDDGEDTEEASKAQEFHVPKKRKNGAVYGTIPKKKKT